MRFLIILPVIIIVLFTACQKPIGGERDEHGCLIAAGYSWCEPKQKCLRPWEEECPMTAEYCTNNGGHWNECSSKCAILNQGKEGVVCTLQCEQLCECGGIAGFNCPPGFQCRMPQGIPDALGYCTSNLKSLTMEQAKEIALNSDCLSEGNLTGEYSYNENSRTWWFNMNADREGCSPACVVYEETESAEINWRCTGLVT